MTAYITGLTNIVALLTGNPILYNESTQMMNIKADALTGAVVFAPALSIGKYKKAGGGFQPDMKIIIEFLKQTQFENDLTQNQTIINDMEALAVEFMQYMNISSVFVHPDEYQTTYVYERFDSNFAGIGLEFNLKLAQPVTSCIKP
jgi:hypothetical protein